MGAMNPPLPPGAPPQPPKKTNWWMIGGCGCMGVIVLGLGMIAVGFFSVMGIIKSTGPYKTALAAAQNSPAVQAELGTPIEAGFFTMGSVNTNSQNGATTEEADLTIPLKGPKGAGKVHYSATKAGNGWNVKDFSVTIDGSGKKIDLSR